MKLHQQVKLNYLTKVEINQKDIIDQTKKTDLQASKEVSNERIHPST